ncbi:unnamed protein product [Diatraea saccharalis]|uniref:DNA polymerase alpha subunit B n=1 Tax=Diatraea saccharalis TaxID=40085 RepID=A0A9N9R481_9NEOP|nr:unnamed protein product [Diatraea saccharalis]
MATEELVTEQFQFLGIDVQKEVVSKCVSLCEEYDVDAESFIEQWMAYSLNHMNGASPTIENLETLARKEFSKRSANRTNPPAKEALHSSTGTGLTVYETTVSSQPDNAVLSNYMSSMNKKVKIETEPIPTLHAELRPATYSPNVDRSAKYASRSNPGSVVYSYGDEHLLQRISQPNISNDILNVNVTQVPNHDGICYTKSMFGFELLHEKASTFDNHISYISRCIMKKAGIAESTSVRHKTQTEVTVAGRIECDADARLNPKCVMLQGTWEESLSQIVSIDMDNLQQYSLFPGQVVVMKGINPRGDKFIAHEVFCDSSLPIPDCRADMMNCLEGTLSILVAAGPYTTSDNLNYEPLKDLVTHITTHKPHVVIMTGPFMDSEHSMVKELSMAETFKSFFEKLVDSLGELNNSCPFTKIYIVSSLKDAFHVNIYPTPAYSSRRKHMNINFLPDPCTLNINGIIVGVTSTDVLMHISQEEISLGMGGDRLSRLAAHIMQQQTYYPLWGAGAGSSLPVDAALWAAHAQLPTTPHVIVLPSNFRYFVKEINGCVVVNPEHLTKGTGGGTFARLLVSAEKESRKICAQILRI